MFDIGFAELLVVAVLGLVVLGPERLPQAIRTLALWLGRFKRSFNNVRTEIEREVGADEIRRQLHNEAVMDELKRAQQQVNRGIAATQRPLDIASIEKVAATATPVIHADDGIAPSEQLDIAPATAAPVAPDAEPVPQTAAESPAESMAEEPLGLTPAAQQGAQTGESAEVPEVVDDPEALADADIPVPDSPEESTPEAPGRKPIKVSQSPYQTRRP